MKRAEDLIWDQVVMPKIEKRERLDIIFNPKYSLPLRARCRTVFVCHGLPAHVMPSGSRWFDRFNHYYLLRQFAHKADAIISVSNSAREHVIEYLGVNEDRVHTVYLGVSEIFREPVPHEKLEETKQRYRLPERFFLYCGQIYPPKNFGRLIQAYARVGPKLGISLVVAGEHAETRLCGEEMGLIDRLGISDWIVQTGWIEQDTLPAFYALAEALLLPSLNEAFGLPLVEAMCAGCPVVTANRYATREIADGAGILVDPEDINSIANGMHQVVTDRGLRHQLIEAGRERSQNFSWKKCARETLQVLEKVFEGSR
jgi:glycosyltransferase involved in cell wall biosynthesis